ncbi:DUF3986 family protein [Domibacillus sp. PGB-M46]|uniref:DUF3986 family protein n=1 Tax=Domibacillus sp. PGB-M46 TaxID=2910255 RepID=UPI001F573F9B|nr:DUF3986 family protein [Domibacillus sp. PGB-M46]MCI2257014.1 DUF3986 family protein [Domibacillus sp. PGB-M46]
MLYDDRYHMHLGYYENGFDLEAIAFKRQSQEIWDIFFDFEQYGLKKPVQETELKEFSIKIFSIESKELDYNYGAKKFEQWLFNQRII